jgi:hypothetical protein
VFEIEKIILKYFVLLLLLYRIMSSFWSPGIQEEIFVSQVILPSVISTTEPREDSAFEKLLPSLGRIEQV